MWLIIVGGSGCHAEADVTLRSEQPKQRVVTSRVNLLPRTLNNLKIAGNGGS
jgi:hypothetical protein